MLTSDINAIIDTFVGCFMYGIVTGYAIAAFKALAVLIIQNNR